MGQKNQILEKNQIKFIKLKGGSCEGPAKFKMSRVKDLLCCEQKVGPTFIGGEKSYPYKVPH
jgi:hypothetical protein